MVEPPAENNPRTNTPDQSRPAIGRDTILQIGVVLLAVALMALVVRVLLGGKAASTSWAIQILLAAATVAGICWGAYQRYRLWTLPVRRLGDLVAAVRRGELPLDELSKIEGVPAVLVPVLRELLEDLKSRRAEIQQLEQEMNQRIANRTDALERMLGTLREKASRDPLTGLLNRRMLDESLPRIVDRCLTEHRSLTVLMIDVDNFKLLNDTLGHAAGDELLRSIGQIIRSTAREADLSFRCGGDEFVVALEGTEPTAGRALSDRLVSLVDALVKTLRVDRRPRLSIGMAHLRDVQEPTAQALLEAADRALYEVKFERKRQVAAPSTAANKPAPAEARS